MAHIDVTPPLTFADLFCGIGGFHIAAARLGMQCVFACDVDVEAQRAYRQNFDMEPVGDITEIPPASIPDHDILLAGFPCQPFSIIGDMRGFDDDRGNLIFNVAEIIDAKRPAAFMLENVRQLSTHNRGRTMQAIISALNELGYRADWSVLNALDFGLPQKRERTIIVGFRDHSTPFKWPERVGEPLPLENVLEQRDDVPANYFASDGIRRKRLAKHESPYELAIWHENKGGNVSSHPFSCALRAGASYNYLLVNGERRLTPREMLRLQGFPEWFELPGTYQQIRKQTGNALPVPVAQAVLGNVMRAIELRSAVTAYGNGLPAPCNRAQAPDRVSELFSTGSSMSWSPAGPTSFETPLVPPVLAF